MPKRLYHLALIIWAAFLSAPSLGQSITATDDTGRVIQIPEPAQRIVSLAPHNTEILFAIGAGPLIKGTVHYSDYPKAALDIPRIGGYDKVNLEKIITLQPDLIVAWQSGNDARANKRLEQLGFPIYYSEPEQLKDIARNMTELGKLTGNSEQGVQAEQRFMNRYEALKTANRNAKTIRIYYEVWHNPRYTLGGTHFTREIFNLCGAENIFSDVEEKAPIVSLEAIISRNPQVILTGDRHGDADLTKLRKQWLQWPNIAAVKNAHIYFVDADIYTRSSPRAIDAAEHLCNLLSDIRRE